MRRVICTIFFVLSIFSIGNSKYTYFVTDIDGNIYSTVAIGEQVWLKENLKTTHYNDSTPIPFVSAKYKWVMLDSGAYTYYHNDKELRNVFGGYYNWHAVNSGKLCPTGWHIPSDDEWNKLEIIIGMDSVEQNYISYRGSSKGWKLKDEGTVEDSTSLWHEPNDGAFDEFGFSALPGGYVYYNNGRSYGDGSYGFWWSSSESDAKESWYRLLYYNSKYMGRNKYNKGYGMSVRCLRDY